MEALQEIWFRAIDQLFNRPDGPLNFRFMVMPIMAVLIAIRSGIRNGRAGKGGFVWAILFSNSTERRSLLRSAIKDIGKMFMVAVVLDTVYQLIVFRAFYIVQALIIAVVCAVIPYVLVRGPVTLITHLCIRKKEKPGAENHE